MEVAREPPVLRAVREVAVTSLREPGRVPFSPEARRFRADGDGSISPGGRARSKPPSTDGAPAPTAGREHAGSVELLGVCRSFVTRSGSVPFVALEGVDLRIDEGEFVSLVGPSGCGKSTLLLIIAGLLEASRGEVRVDGSPVRGPRRSVGVMFQTPELFPWRNVLDNVLLPIDVFRLDRREHVARARELIHLAGLDGFERAHPHELSGGMQQRTALCRVLMADPDIVLMDEPFGALDEFTRERLNMELLGLWERTRKTIVFVTHNIGEAVFLSDRVAVMGTNPGRVLRVVPIGLPRPRSFATMRDPSFNARVFEIRELLGVGR